MADEIIPASPDLFDRSRAARRKKIDRKVKRSRPHQISGLESDVKPGSSTSFQVSDTPEDLINEEHCKMIAECKKRTAYFQARNSENYAANSGPLHTQTRDLSQLDVYASVRLLEKGNSVDRGSRSSLKQMQSINSEFVSMNQLKNKQEIYDEPDLIEYLQAADQCWSPMEPKTPPRCQVDLSEQINNLETPTEQGLSSTENSPLSDKKIAIELSPVEGDPYANEMFSASNALHDAVRTLSQSFDEVDTTIKSFEVTKGSFLKSTNKFSIFISDPDIIEKRQLEDLVTPPAKRLFLDVDEINRDEEEVVNKFVDSQIINEMWETEFTQVKNSLKEGSTALKSLDMNRMTGTSHYERTFSSPKKAIGFSNARAAALKVNEQVTKKPQSTVVSRVIAASPRKLEMSTFMPPGNVVSATALGNEERLKEFETRKFDLSEDSGYEKLASTSGNLAQVSSGNKQSTANKCDNNFNSIPYLPGPAEFVGFKNARTANVMAVGNLNNEPHVTVVSIENCNPPPMNVVFTTARGNKMQQKVPRKNIFAGLDDELQKEFEAGKFDLSEDSGYERLVSTSANLAQVSSGNKQSTSNKCDNNFNTISHLPVANEFAGFKSSRTAGRNLNSEPQSTVVSISSPHNTEMFTLTPPAVAKPPPKNVVFTTARGNTMQQKVPRKNIFAGLDDELQKEFEAGKFDLSKDSGYDRLVSTSANLPHTSSANKHSTNNVSHLPVTNEVVGFRTTRGPKPNISDGGFENALNFASTNAAIGEEMENDFDLNLGKPSAKRQCRTTQFDTPPKPTGFKVATHLLYDRSSTPIVVQTKSNPMSLTQETSDLMAAFLQDENDGDRTLENVFCNSLENPPSAIAAPVESSPRQNKLRQTKLLHRFNTAEEDAALLDDSYDEKLSHAIDEASKLNSTRLRPTLTEEVGQGRRAALLEQNESLAAKMKVHRSKRPGKLFLAKQQSAERVKLSDCFGKKLRNVMDEEMCGLFTKIAGVSAANATNFLFDMENYYSSEICETNITGLQMADNATLIFNEHSQVGLADIEASFLQTPGVDPRLVPPKWVENAFKWIVLKLAAMERQFSSASDNLTHYLNPETVLLQLKYRYDREIDNAQRPALRKILEFDDISSKPMCLFVAQIFETHVELSDGWYGIRTRVDPPLKHFMKTGKIKVGTKLMLQNAELVNAGEVGRSPLEVADQVRLAIFANSTRRAYWDTKLGYCSRPRPLRIALNSAIADGGIIAETSVCILRVYPMMYSNKSEPSSGNTSFQTERVQQRHSIKVDVNKFAIAEKTQLEIQLEYEAEKKVRFQRYHNTRKSLPKSLADVTDIEELCDLIEFIGDSEVELTETQKKLIANHQEAVKAEHNTKLNKRLKKNLTMLEDAERLVCPILKVRICDVRETSSSESMMLSIWRPPEDLVAMFREGRFVRMSQVLANKMQYGILQITNGKFSRFEALKEGKDNFVRNAVTMRRLTSISEVTSDGFAPFCNEFDVVGVVVKVGPLSKFQIIYLADIDMNILSIQFWGGVAKFAYEDLIKVKTVLCASNVQRRPAVITGHVTEYTTFKRRPEIPQHNSAVTALTTELAAINLDEFVEKCCVKIAELPIKSPAIGTPLRTTALNNTSLNRTPQPQLNEMPREFSPSVSFHSARIQEKYNILSRWPSPPPLPNINLNDSPNFKRRKTIPSRLVDNAKN